MKREKDNINSKELTLTEIMLEFVRAAVLERAPVISSDVVVDWDKLMDISTEQGLIAWVWDGISKLPVEQQPPRLQRINWGLSAQEIWQRYEHQKEVLSEMIEICRQSDIRLLLMKGLGLSELYPKPQSRPSGDIDIYLFGDFERGNLLFSDTPCPETGLHTSFYYKGVEIENHKIFVYNNSKVKGLVGEYVLGQVDNAIVSSCGYYTLPPMANLAYLLMHALNHVNYESGDTILSIRNILDIGMFLRHYKEQLPPSDVYVTLKQVGLDKSFELVVYLSEWLIGIDFKEYHAGLVKRKDVPVIRDLFLKQGLAIPYMKDESVLRNSCALWKRYNILKPISKYIPKKPKCGLFHVTFHSQCVYCIRHLFNLPDGYPIKDGLRHKFKLCNTR